MKYTVLVISKSGRSWHYVDAQNHKIAQCRVTRFILDEDILEIESILRIEVHPRDNAKDKIIYSPIFAKHSGLFIGWKEEKFSQVS